MTNLIRHLPSPSLVLGCWRCFTAPRSLSSPYGKNDTNPVHVFPFFWWPSCSCTCWFVLSFLLLVFLLINRRAVCSWLPAFLWLSFRPPGLSHSWLVSVIEATNIATMFNGCCHWWQYWWLMVRMEYWGTPLIMKKLLTYPKWMQSRMNHCLPGCAERISGPVTLGNRLLPLLISKRARGGTCTITSILNPNSSMMLKTTSCWYCSREPLVRNSLWVGINKTNNSPNGTSTSLTIPCPVVEDFFSRWVCFPVKCTCMST
jgi:hypothetical protein